MFGKMKNKAGETPAVASLGLGLASTGLITLLGSIVTAILIDLECLPESKMGLAAVVILCAASFLGAVITSKMVGENRMLFCILNGALYLLLLACANWLCFDGAFQGVLGAVLTIIGCSAVAAMLATQQKRQKTSYFKKR